MIISRDVQKKLYDAYSTQELVDIYVNSELTDIERSVLSECLLARGKQLHLLDGQKARLSAYIESPFIKEEVKKGTHSIFNFRRWSTWLAFLVGLPLIVDLNTHGWNIGFAVLVSILPIWVVFYIIEHYMTKKKIVSLSDVELTNIVDAKVGELGYEIQTIARDELKRRPSYLSKPIDGNVGESGITELMVCASKGDIENAKKHLASGDDINTRNVQGGTALLIAVLNNHPSMVSLLLKHGADASIASNKGLTAKAIATNNKYNEILQLLNAAKV